MAKCDGLEIRFEDEALDALMRFTEAMDSLAAAIAAATEARLICGGKYTPVRKDSDNDEHTQ